MAIEVKEAKFVIEIPLVIGEAAEFRSRTRPDCNFRGRLLKTNAPDKNFAIVDDFKVGNVSCLFGGSTDAVIWTKNEGHEYDIPTATPTTTFTLNGTYTGLVPEGMKQGDTFIFKLEIDGFSSSFEEDVSDERPTVVLETRP